MVTIKLEGIEDLKKALDGKVDEYRAALESVVRNAAESVKSEWRADVPVDEGDYRDSIAAEVTGLTAEIANVGKKGRHGRYVEFGTSKMRARPSAQPAAERERDRFPERVRGAIRDRS